MNRHGEDRIYPKDDERPHTVGNDPFWQESVVIFWWDEGNGVGGYQRIGHEPHLNGGTSHLFSFVCSTDGRRYRAHASKPFSNGDRSDDGFAFGNSHSMRFDDRARWRIDDSPIEVDISVDDFFPAMDLWPRSSGTLSSEIAAGHTECAGTVGGRARLQARELSIAGLCYRDHSWGKRDWSKLGQHIWLAASCGPELSLSGIEFKATDGSAVKESLIVRSGLVESTRDFSVAFAMNPHSAHLQPGHLDFRLASGELISASYTPIDGVASLLHGYLMFDYICVLDVGGKRGFLALEFGRRHDQSVIPETVALASNNGWSSR